MNTAMGNTSGDKSLELWASKKFPLFLIFKLSGNSGGSTVCVIEDFSSDVLRLSWAGETELNRRGEFILSLQGASRTISDIDVPDLISGSDFIDPNEPFVKIALPSGDRFWLVMMRPSELDDIDPNKYVAISEAVRRDEELSSGRAIGRTHEEVMRSARRALECD
jgi:hypothetical protein